MIGYLGNVTDIVVARPSPSLTRSEGPPQGVAARVVRTRRCCLTKRPSGPAFTESCLVAAPGKFTVNFNNNAPGIPHNFAVLDKEGGKQIGATEVAPGPIKQTLSLDLKAGTYYFQCDVHTFMNGTLAVVDGAK